MFRALPVPRERSVFTAAEEAPELKLTVSARTVISDRHTDHHEQDPHAPFDASDISVAPLIQRESLNIAEHRCLSCLSYM